MPGLQLGSGLGVGGSVFAGGYPGYGAAAVPAATTVPEGPATITQQAFGVPSAGSGSRKGLSAAFIGTLALIGLAFIWWSLPR
jgi:hypothetical protein